MAGFRAGGTPKHERAAVIAWLEYGGTPPWWVDTLILAEKWGIPPWEIEEGPAEWFERGIFLESKIREKEKRDAEKWQTQK